VIVTAAGASAALADTMHHKLIDADLGIRTRLVGRLCNLKCFFEGGGDGEKAEEFPTIGANVDSVLALQCNWCCVEKFTERLGSGSVRFPQG
jgi:hypothetical protein